MTRLYFFLALTFSFVHSATAQSVDGILEPAKDIYIKTTVDGIVTQVDADEGEIVRQGSIIVKFNDSEQEAKVALAKTIASATSAVSASRERASQAKRKYKDLQTAMNNGAATEWEILDAKTNATLATLDLTAAQEENTANKKRLILEETILSRYRFEAPFAGTLSEIFVTEGQSVSRGDNIARLINTNTLEIEAYIEAEFFNYLVKEKSYSAKVAEPFNQSFTVTLSHIDPVFDPATGSVRVVFTATNDEALPAGTNATISLLEKSATHFPEQP